MSLIRSAQRKKLLLLAGVCLVGTSSVYAEDDFDLGALFDLQVTTASKRAEKLEDAPGVITSISRYEIDRMGARNLAEILAQVPGLQMYNSEAFGVNKASIRGDAFSYLDNHTLILVNGRPIREGVRQGFNAPVYKLFPINVIERVEIVRGPGSVLYGSTAMTGVINIITQKNDDKNALMVGTSNKKDIYESSKISFVSPNKQTGFIFANQFHNNAGREDTILTKTLIGEPIAFGKKMQTADIGLFGQLYHKDLTVTSFFGRTEYSHFGWMDPTQASDNNRQARLFLNVDYKTKLNDNWEIMSSGTWNKIDLKLTSNGRRPNDIQYPDQFPDGQENKFGYENSSDFLLESYISGTIIENLNVLGGGLISNENKWQIPDTRSVKLTTNFTDPTGDTLVVENDAIGTRVPNRYHNMFYSGYGQIDYRFLDRYKLIAGFQVNKPENEDVDIVPRFGAVVDIWNGLGVKVLYGHAFRSPIMPEKAFVEPNTDLSAGTLKPEKVKTLDAQVFFTQNKLSASATYFNSVMTNFISLSQAEPPFGGFYNNTDKILSSGVELEAKISPLTGLMVSGSWMYQNTNKVYDKDAVRLGWADGKFSPIMVKEGDTLFNVSQAPNNIWKMGITYTSPFKLTGGLFAEQYGVTSLFGKNKIETRGEPVPSLILNTNVGYTLPFEKEITINVGVRNILDDGAKQSHLLSASRPTDFAHREPGRTVQVSLTSSF